MRSSWNDDHARECVQRYAAHGEALALRLYTSRLIGRQSDLVLHGGGNTSVKTRRRDLFGREIDVLCVKGSGADLAAVEPAGMPALELEPLRRLRALDRLDDDAMVAELRRRMLDPSGPDPSIETLLHAFLPHAFVDHTHADAILLLTNQEGGERLVREALGDDVPTLPWIMPGFPLAKAVADLHERQPRCRGIVLLHHGLFTFGDTAQQSYERTIELVDRAERFAAARTTRVSVAVAPAAPLPAGERSAVWRRTLPLLRAVCGGNLGDASRARPADWTFMTAELRAGDAAAAFSARADAAALCATGPITPDHVIRTKGRYLFLTREQATDRGALERAIADYVGWYKGYFERCAQPRGVAAMLFPLPVVAVVAGCGLVGLMPNKRGAKAAADVAEHTVAVWGQGNDLGRYVPLPEAELAAMEYWPLELRKLGRAQPPPLGGRIAIVTGAAGAIGHAVADALLRRGACVCVTDLDAARLDAVGKRLASHGERVVSAAADLCDPRQVEAVFDACVLAFGGVDVVAPCHGIATTGRLEQIDAAALRRLVDANATSTMLVLQRAAAVLRAQGMGGSVVLQVSKSTFAPGAGFGAYAASKAMALQLGRVAALEFAEFGVRVNMINADAVFGDDAVPSQLWQHIGEDRMRARGLDADGLRAYYRDRSLLKRSVTAEQVAEAVVFFAAHAPVTTGAVLPVDAGLPEAFPR